MKKRKSKDKLPMPASLEQLLQKQNAELLEVMPDVLDLELSREAWADAAAAGDDFDLDLSGVNRVHRFATQSDGSIYGLLVGEHEQTKASLEACPVVHISSDGEAARVAKDLRQFWVVMIALNRLATDIVCRVDGDRAELKEALVAWRAQQEEDDTVTLRALRQLTGTEDEILTDEQAVDLLFDCDAAEPRFRPRSQDDDE